MPAWLKRLDHFLHRHLAWCFLFLLIVVLRLPNFSEPYWYGDEAIYLTIGTSLRQGALLYAEIVDHKTPLIYYLAMVPSQFWFRVLLFGWMTITAWLFYKIISKLVSKPAFAQLATVLFILLTSLPAFEGNIPNGELFVMGFVVLGTYLATQYQPWQLASKHDTKPSHSRKGWLGLVLGGISLGLGVLLKVPGLFDLVAVAGLGWWLTVAHLDIRKPIASFKTLVTGLSPSIMVGLAALLPILASILYYWSRGTIAAYLDFGLLYNFHYAGNWQLNLQPSWLNILFTLPAKAAIMLGLVAIISLLTHKVSWRWQWTASWLVLALFASLLSNRPYPHYFLQLFLPLALLLGVTMEEIWLWWQHRKPRTYLYGAVGTLCLAIILAATLKLVNVWLYQTVSYYTRFAAMATGRINPDQYRVSFNPIIPDNERAAAIITEAGEKRLFIWGTNPTLYALSQTRPIGRFTVAFHIKDLKLEAETLQVVMAANPKFIVVMHEENNTLPGLNEYLNQNYVPNTSFTHFTLWKRI